MINRSLHDVDMKIKLIKIKITSIITGNKLGEETTTEGNWKKEPCKLVKNRKVQGKGTIH